MYGFASAVTPCGRGYTDNELGLEWIKNFDAQTDDGSGRVRFLFLDGHGSHCTLEFLEYAVTKKIIVCSAPPHTTHETQGLDKTCFGPLKVFWSQEKQLWESTYRQTMAKESFLQVYAQARRRAFTKTTILSAFRTTGISPFNRNAIPEDRMAPALEHSTRGGFPIPLPTPARAIVAAHRDRRLLTHQNTIGSPTPVSSSLQVTRHPHLSTQDENARQANPSTASRAPALSGLLRPTSVRFLVSASPIRPTSRLPRAVFQTARAALQPDYSVLAKPRPEVPSRRDLEVENQELRLQLQKARNLNKAEKSINEGVQAQLVLRDLHLDELTERLHHQETKKSEGRKRLMSSKAARFLTGPQFLQKLKEQEAEDVAKAAQKGVRLAVRDRTKQRNEWRKKEQIEREKSQQAALAAWAAKVEECKRKRVRKLPEKPKIRKLFPRAPTPDHLKAGTILNDVVDDADDDEDDVWSEGGSTSEGSDGSG